MNMSRDWRDRNPFEPRRNPWKPRTASPDDGIQLISDDDDDDSFTRISPPPKLRLALLSHLRPTSNRTMSAPTTPTTPTKTASSPPLPRPAAHLTWEVYGDKVSQRYLEKTTTIDEYRSACRFFHGRLAFVVRGLNVFELRSIFLACLPSFLKEGYEHERKAALEAFETAHDRMDRELTTRFLLHANKWLESPAGTCYRDQYLESR